MKKKLLFVYYRVCSFFRTINNWICEHFTIDFFHLLMTVFKGYAWDYQFLYELEKAKLEEMANYIEKSNRFVGVEYVVRDIRLCIKLLEIMNRGGENLFHYDGELTETKLENGKYEIGTTPDFKYICDVKVNTKNIDRFIPKKESQEMYLKMPHELYLLKAKYLYHLIRYKHEQEWWD